jgi:hypothetical protein
VILDPFAILGPEPIHGPSIRQVHYQSTRKDYEETAGRDSAEEPDD